MQSILKKVPQEYTSTGRGTTVLCNVFKSHKYLKTQKKVSCIYKMETYTVKKLRAIAKERGIKRYSSLRKAELIQP